MREAWLVQLFFSFTSTDEQIVELIKERGKNIREIVESYKAQIQVAIPQDLPPGLERARALWQLTLDYGLAFYEFELKWNKEMLRRVKNFPR